MHKLLLRQLKKAGLTNLNDIKDERWLSVLNHVDAAYCQADDERYTNERANEMSSKEMESLYHQLKLSSESALSAERDRLKLVLKSIGHGLFLLSSNGIIIDTNSASENLLGWCEDELIGAPIANFILTEGSALDLTYLQNVPKYQFRRKHCVPLYVSYVLSPIVLGGNTQGAVLIFRDISKQLANEKTLIDAKLAAEKANRAKSEFLSCMSHELRTPMNAILGFAQLLELSSKEYDDNQLQSISQIKLAGSHLLNLINDVLDLAKIEAGKMTVYLEEVAVTQVLEECLTLIMNQANDRQIQLIINSSVASCRIQADEIRLKQIFLNLLSNAVKYNCVNGSVTIDSKIVAEQYIHISISDTGSGLSRSEIDRLFTQFERLENEHKIEGTGIGLVITKHLVELMEGRIGVESTLGKGSTFWVEFKL